MKDALLRVLLVEDESSLREPLAKRLRDKYHYQVDTAANGEEAWQRVCAAKRAYDVALIDDLLIPAPEIDPEPSGIELMQKIKEVYPDTECIVFTGWGMDRALVALQAGAYRYLTKPLNLDELGITIRLAAEQTRLRQERDLLSTILKITNTMVSGLDLARTLEVIVEAVSRLVGAESCSVVLMNPTINQVQYDSGSLIGQATIKWKRHLKNTLLTRQIIQTGELYNLADVETQADEILDEQLLQAGVKSFIGVPIPGETGNQGVLYAYSTHREAFGIYEQRVLKLLADQAAIALENTRLFEAEAQRRQEAETLRETALVLTTSLKPGEIFERILTELQRVVPYDSASVQLLKGDRLEIIGGCGFPNLPEIVGLSFLVNGEKNPNREVVRRRECFIVSNAPAEYEVFLKEPHVQAGIRSWLGVPMLVGDQLIGMITLDKHQPNFYIEEHARLARAFATQAALAIENGRLFEEANHRARNLETLQNLALTINSSLDLNEVLKSACQDAVEFFSADHSGLVLFDLDYTQGCVTAEYPELGIVNTNIPIKDIPAEEQLIKTRQPLIIEQVNAAESMGVVRDILLNFDIQSLLIIPVISKNNELLGSFSLDAVGHLRRFSTEEVELCRVFAAHVAVAVENARLFSEMVKAKNWREALVENANDAVIAIDQNKKINIFNQRAEEMLGWASGEVINKTAARLYLDVEKAQEIFEAVNRGESVKGWHVDFKHRDGSRIPALLSGTLIRDKDGRSIGQAGYIRDLRQVTLLEERLRALIQVSQVITGVLELDEVLERIVSLTVEAFPMAQRGTLYLYDELTDTLWLRANTFGYSPKVIDALSLRSGEGIAGWVFQHRQPTVVADAHQDPRYKRFNHPEVPLHKSMVCVPLNVRGRIIGTLSLDNLDVAGVFQADDLELLATFADQVAIAVTNAQYFEEIQKGLKQLRSLYEAGSAIISAMEPKQTLRIVVEEACQALAGWRSKIILISRKGELTDLVAVGFGDGLDTGEMIRPDGISVQVMTSGEPWYTEDVQKLPDRVNPVMLSDGVRAAACVPFGVRDCNIGVMWIHYRVPRIFLPTETEALRLYANQAAIAYDNTRRMRELEHLHQAAEKLASVASVQEVLQQVVKSAKEVLEADSVVIWSYDDIRHTFLPDELITEGIRPKLVERFRKDEPRSGGTAEVVMERKYVAISNTDDPEYAFLGPIGHGLRGTIGVRAFQGISLQVGQETLGVLYVNYKLPRTFGREDKITLETFANHAALTLKKARLLEQVSRTRDTAKIVARVSVLENLQSTLHSIVKGTYEALQCDAVTLYTYDQTRDEFGFPPTMFGVHNEEEVLKIGSVVRESVVRNILALDKPYIAEDASSDPIVGGVFVQREGIKSSVSILLKVGSQKVGVMFINYRSHHRFTGEELNNIELFSYQAAIAISNARLLADMSHRRMQLQTVAEVSKSTSTILDPDVLISQAVNLIRQRFNVYYVGLFLTDETGEYLVLRAGTDEAGQKMLKEKHKLPIGGHSMVGWSAAHRQARIAPDVDKDDVHFDNPYLPKTRSELSLPLISRDQCIGALTVQSVKEAAFSQEDIAILQTMADQLAIAIENARLYQAEQQRNKELSGLHRISQTISSLTDIQEVYQRVNESIAELTNVQMCAILLYDEVERKLVCQLPLYGVPDALGQKYHIPLDKDDLATLWETMPHLILNEAEGDPLVTALGLNDLIKEAGLRDTLLVKLVVGRRNIGIIQASNKLDGMPFNEDDARLLRIFAGQAAAVIENARLYEQLKQTNEDLRRTKGLVGARTAVAWMGMTSSAWRHTIEKHALTIQEQAQLLHRDFKQLSSHSEQTKISKRAATIERLAAQILKKPITPPLSTEAGMELVSINELVSERAKQLWQNDPYKKTVLCFDLQLPAHLTLWLSPEWLRRAFDILVDNAVKAVDGCKIQEIIIGTQLTNAGVEISVSDTGSGIPQELRDKIGYEPIQKPDEAKGLGMGLLMVQTIVQTYGGEVRVAVTGPKGTKMVIWLPVKKQ
ncbi:MAG: GAF domain-containing protein [Anaerolineae bacterium]|nr:GAF domain-containing protein [Anaerolineae bacterium]